MTEMAQRLQRLVEEAVEDKPYVVESTDSGFDVSSDLGDHRWTEKFQTGGVVAEMTWHVRVDDKGHYSITDDSRYVEWQAGPGGVGGRWGRWVGHISPGRSASWEFADGRLRKVRDEVHSFEGRDLITAAAQELGLSERKPLTVKVAIVVGALVAIGLVVMGLVLVWLALTRSL